MLEKFDMEEWIGQNPTETLAGLKLAEQRVGGEDSHKQRGNMCKGLVYPESSMCKGPGVSTVSRTQEINKRVKELRS